MPERRIRSVSDGVGITYQLGEIPRYDNKKVVNIKYHTPLGEGDRHDCDIDMEDGKTYRLFQISRITFEPEE